jgi:hypothetical protein
MSDFTQVVVWPGTLLGNNTPAEFEEFVSNELSARVKFIGEFTTGPDFDDPTTGGREDLLFYVHTEDIPKFAVARLAYGMRWLEDVLDNEKYRNTNLGAPEGYSIYPEEVTKLYSWK